MSAGLFLGRRVSDGVTTSEPFLLEPSDLTTHGLIVGMTGSGKTALGIVLIEELLRRGIPVLAIDPKGDLGNLLLDFPALSPAEFAPWVDPSSGATAEGESARWAKGLSGWGLGPAEVGALRDSREAVIYTPGSSAGVPLDLLGSLPAPAGGNEDDRRDLVTAFVTGILGLVGIDADPVSSRESILLSRCIESIWEKGDVATLESLVLSAATPPFGTVGALPLETFFPGKERQALVLALNNLLASSTTTAFRSGVPLDVASMLAPSAGGKTRLSIVSIAHLSDAERIFVVATLMTRVKAWMRAQPGTGSLRALVYVDEIFGFFPPSAEPPTKRPMLTLLKQARAFGLGVVLATQNPVDLDYKGLANCGCWWVGTLQTERDRKRLAEGLTEASGSSEPAALLSGTRKRVFLVHDIHRPAAMLVETRWAMSYLRGPMTREEIARTRGTLAATVATPPPAAAARGEGAAARGEGAAAQAADSAPPPAPSGWSSSWVEKRGAEMASPYLLVKYAVRYKLEKGSAPEVTGAMLFALDAPSAGEVLESDPLDGASLELLAEAPSRRLRYAGLPSWFGNAATKQLERSVKERLPDRLAVRLLKDPVSGALGSPGEDAEAFAARVATTARPPATVVSRLEKKRADLARAEADERGRSMETMASMASAAMDLVGGFLGKRKSLKVGKVGGVLSKKRMEDQAESKIETLKAEIAALEAQVAPPDPSRFEEVDVVPSRSNVDILAVGLTWVC